MTSFPIFNKIKMHKSLRLFVETFWHIDNLHTKKPSKRDIIYNLTRCNLEDSDSKYSSMLAKFYFDFWSSNDLINPQKVKDVNKFIDDYILEYRITFYENAV